MQGLQDLTTGSVPKKLVRFALPLLLANLLQSLYSVADMLVVGHIVGKAGLAAVSNASMIGFVVNSLCIGFTMGGAVLIGQYRGAKDEKGQAGAVLALLILSLLAALLITAIGLGAYRPLLRRMGVPGAALKDAQAYMQVLLGGTVFVFGYNGACSILKGLGDAKSPLLFVAVAATVNVALDLLLVGPWGLGTAGAAYATVISQGISLLFALWRVRRMGVFTAMRGAPRMAGGRMLRALLKLGLPTAAQMAVVNLSYLAVTAMLNQFGVAVAAAAGVGLKVNTFAGMPCWALGQAVTAMAAQNAGAREMGRLRQTLRTGLCLNLAVTACVAALVQAFAEPILALFGPAGPQAAREGVLYLRLCCSVNSLVYAAMYTFDSFSIGVGSPQVAMLDALLDAAVLRLPLCWLLGFSLGYGSGGVYLGQALSPLLPAVVGLAYCRAGRWRKRVEAALP